MSSEQYNLHEERGNNLQPASMKKNKVTIRDMRQNWRRKKKANKKGGIGAKLPRNVSQLPYSTYLKELHRKLCSSKSGIKHKSLKG